MRAELADDLHQPVEHLGMILELRLAGHHRALADGAAAARAAGPRLLLCVGRARGRRRRLAALAARRYEEERDRETAHSCAYCAAAARRLRPAGRALDPR